MLLLQAQLIRSQMKTFVKLLNQARFKFCIIVMITAFFSFMSSEVSVSSEHFSQLQMVSVTGGGKGNDEITELAIFNEEYLVAAGTTSSVIFRDGIESVHIGATGKTDIFLALINKENLLVEKVLFVGGTSEEQLRGMAFDSTGKIFITGSTFSHDFPHDQVIGAPELNGKTNIFLLKISSDLNGVEMGILLGGSDYDYPTALNINSGVLFLGGHTGSANFPVSSTAVSNTFNDTPPEINSYGLEAYIMSLDTASMEIKAATFISGAQDEFIADLVFDNEGDLLAIGWSTSLDLFEETITGKEFSGSNIFVARLHRELSEVKAKYITSLNNQFYPKDAAVDAEGNVWVTGYCTYGSFKPPKGVFQDKYMGGGYDSFVMQFSRSLDEVKKSTFLGGNNNDFAQSIYLSEKGGVRVAGFTDSFKSFETTQNFNQSYFNFGHYDTFVMEFGPDLTSMFFSIMDGSSMYDFTYAMIADGKDTFIGGSVVSRGAKKDLVIQRITERPQGESNKKLGK